MRPQTFGNSVLKGEKVEKTLGWTKDETNVDMGKGGRTKNKNLCADLKKVSASERKTEILNFLGDIVKQWP